MTLTALSAVFSEAPAYPNEAEMDNQMSTNSTQWVILGHAAGNTSKAKQRTVGQDATKRSRGSGGGAHGVNQGGGGVNQGGRGRGMSQTPPRPTP